MSKKIERFPGFRSPTYTIVPDELFDDLLADLSGAELKVLLYIIRRTFGFKKGSDHISKAQLEHGIRKRDGTVLDRGTGLSRRAIRLAVDSLVEQNILLKYLHESADGGHDTTEYALHVLGAVSDPGVLSTPPPGKKVPHPLGRGVPQQQTGIQETDPVVVVRDTLEKFGITAAAAERLTAAYPEAHILEKVDLVQWLVETHSPLVGKNPAGYLRRAIEEDYTPPPKYRSPAQRQAEARERDAAADAAQRERQEAEAAYAQEKVLNQQRLRGLYPPELIAGTELTTREAWEQTLDRLHGQLSRLNFETWLANTALVHCSTDTALVVAPSRFQVEHLTTRLQPLVTHALAAVVGVELTCAFVPAAELLDAATGEAGRGPLPPDVIRTGGKEALALPDRTTTGQVIATG